MDKEKKSKYRLFDNINVMFKDMSYFQMYNHDIWITILVILIVASITIFFFFKNTVESQKINWESEKCNPLYMPFGSLLNKNVSDGFNETNFNECTNNLLFGISIDLKNPLSAIFSIFGGLFALVSSVLSAIMGFLLYLFNMIMNLFRQLINIIKKIIASTAEIFSTVSNTVGHALGFVGVLYNQISILVDSIKLIFPVMAASFIIAVIIPTIAFLIFCIIMWFVGLALLASIFLSWLGAAIMSLFSVLIVICILILIFFLLVLAVLIAAGKRVDSQTRINNLNNKEILPVEPPTVEDVQIELGTR